jgi:alkylhydroperoxidase/carboxymuconolactone decarboxylase family protein YurZ
MTMPSDAGSRYRIILRGECGTLSAGVLGELAIESCRGWTCVVASVRDESEFYGLLDRIQDLALHIVSLNELGADVIRSRSATRRVPVSFGRCGKRRAAWLADVAARAPAVLAAAQGPVASNIEESGLAARSHALVRLAGLVAAGQHDESAAAYEQHVTTALDHGVTPDEIVGVLVALLPTVGTARVAAAAPAVLSALGRATAEIPAGRLTEQP